jgi:hypothetical protein
MLLTIYVGYKNILKSKLCSKWKVSCPRHTDELEGFFSILALIALIMGVPNLNSESSFAFSLMSFLSRDILISSFAVFVSIKNCLSELVFIF